MNFVHFKQKYNKLFVASDALRSHLQQKSVTKIVGNNHTIGYISPDNPSDVWNGWDGAACAMPWLRSGGCVPW